MHDESCFASDDPNSCGNRVRREMLDDEEALGESSGPASRAESAGPQELSEEATVQAEAEIQEGLADLEVAGSESEVDDYEESKKTRAKRRKGRKVSQAPLPQ